MTLRKHAGFVNTETSRGERGFTLIEVLVVSAIVGILAAIAVPQYAAYKEGSADAGAKSDLHNLATGLEAYYTEVNTYAGTTLPVLKANGFRQTADVTATIDTADATHFVIEATAARGTGTFTYDSSTGQTSGP